MLRRAVPTCRYARESSSWTSDVTRTSNTVQSYVSKSNDPFLNLCIEQYLLKRSSLNSAVLFLYTNRPCIVIGRNQNPWYEVNLKIQKEKTRLGKVDLVRRRSGGGTVFHDEGNVNWTVISPSGTFTRDKHAEMVVRALRHNGIEAARVNERHDIVLDQGHTRKISDPANLHQTPFTADARTGPIPLKVSGSAYKLTRGRALHHGTCLLSSPNLALIPQYLHSPAKPYINAKGVESVSSPVSNVGLDEKSFLHAVQQEFKRMYQPKNLNLLHCEIGEDALTNVDIKQDWDSIQTHEWTFGQTPQFSFSSHPTDEDNRKRPPLPRDMSQYTQVYLDVRHGQVTESKVSMSDKPDVADAEAKAIRRILHDRKLHNISGWEEIFSQVEFDATPGTIAGLVKWLNRMLPTKL